MAGVMSHEVVKATYCYLNISQEITCIIKLLMIRIYNDRPDNEKEDIDNTRSENFV